MYHFDNVNNTGVFYSIYQTEVNFLLKLTKTDWFHNHCLIIELEIVAKVLPNLELNKVLFVVTCLVWVQLKHCISMAVNSCIYFENF